MDHKVYPVPPEPSAPPAHSREPSISTQSSGSTIAIQMPDEHALRKEQEKSLMHADAAAEAGVHKKYPPPQPMPKDFIYKVPQPLPRDHPSVIAAHRKRRRCGGCCCCLAYMCATLAILIVVLGIAALVAYLVLQPKTPDFSVSDATVASFNLTSTPTSPSNAVSGVSQYLNADVTFNVSAENPNKKIGIYYDEVDVTLFYEGEQIGQGSIPAFYQGHRNTTILLLHMVGKDVAMTPAIGSGLQTALKDSASTVLLHARTLTTVRVKVGGWKSGASKFEVDCDVEMSNPSAPNPRVLNKNCSFKVKKIRIL
ncbi:hypothetical protein KP509_30G026900 [Ceratopteris richardii]|uniref:Late embryogenesis abundant protein LEA-2 subgroup domain-containing protein n=2 Tax=Ceratopteris richardii TaxID=49495 RepID=A0A8T2R353_CERRI|nr:hypothetical protein KP509_30G026900 [Ceratopteris richardii]